MDDDEIMPTPRAFDSIRNQNFSDVRYNALITEIPFLGISKDTLERFPTFSARRHHAAALYDRSDRSADCLPRRNVKEPSPDAWPEEEEIRMEDLQECLRNPLSFYFSQNLHVRLKKERKKNFEKGEFALSFHDLLSLTRKSITTPLDAVVAAAKQRGEFPMGAFEQLAYRAIQEKRDEVLEQMELFKVIPEKCFSVILSRLCDKPEKITGSLWLLPAWRIDIKSSRPIYVTGKIEAFSPEGLICYADNRASQLIAHWPLYLLLADHPDLKDIPTALLPVLKKTKSKEKITWQTSDVKEEIGKLLCYYKQAKDSISPFLSEWVPDFFGPFEKMEKELWSETASIYLKWLREQGGIFVEGLCRVWQPYVKTTFQSFLTKFEKTP
jgi:exonuclease V gamma subunit